MQSLNWHFIFMRNSSPVVCTVTISSQLNRKLKIINWLDDNLKSICWLYEWSAMMIPHGYVLVGNNKDKMHVSNNREMINLRWISFHRVFNWYLLGRDRAVWVLAQAGVIQYRCILGQDSLLLQCLFGTLTNFCCLISGQAQGLIKLATNGVNFRYAQDWTLMRFKFLMIPGLHVTSSFSKIQNLRGPKVIAFIRHERG